MKNRTRMPTPQPSVWRRRCKKNLPFERSYFYIYTTHGIVTDDPILPSAAAEKDRSTLLLLLADTRLLCLRCHRLSTATMAGTDVLFDRGGDDIKNNNNNNITTAAATAAGFCASENVDSKRIS
ncbi:hypothetical protein QTP88_004280 [Uroleucon formosanum]